MGKSRYLAANAHFHTRKTLVRKRFRRRKRKFQVDERLIQAVITTICRGQTVARAFEGGLYSQYYSLNSDVEKHPFVSP